MIDGGPAVSAAVPTLRGVYTQRLADIATQDSVSDSRHPDYNLYTYCVPISKTRYENVLVYDDLVSAFKEAILMIAA